jgi:Tol biopolymer transport system component
VQDLSSSRRRLALFAGLVAACAVAAVVAVVLGIRGNDSSVRSSAGARTALEEARAAGRPVMLYLRGGQQRRDTQVALAAAGGSSAGKPTPAPLSCTRVYFASGRGICLARDHSLAAGYKAEIFDSELRVHDSLDLPGLASRARVSPDGRYGAATMFVSGDSYAAAGSFSTRTTLIDLASGSRIADLEQFTVTRDGRQVTAVDVNYWGVTFARDSDRFYATMATGGKTYLIQGSISARTAHTLHENVECPSLSPDGTRIAFKKRTRSSSNPWHLTVLDLRTMRETPLAEARSVDDQAEWLDDQHVLYAVDGAVWSVPADGTGRPARYIARAGSPSVVRWRSGGS